MTTAWWCTARGHAKCTPYTSTRASMQRTLPTITECTVQNEAEQPAAG